ncbi:MAG: cupin domain-containing protein [Kiritimatiellae bacterium]|nr:cupin domain-containing protein [Kiritimatiellia bacterium]
MGKDRKTAQESGKVGERIRRYREARQWGVADLAAKSGLDANVVNAIEKGEVLPALGVLTRLARALGQRLGTFMDDQFKPDPIITRASDIAASKVAGEGVNTLGYASHSLALGKPDRHMDPFRIEFEADGVDAVSSHEGEELIICIDGEVELAYGPDRTVLRAGDTAYYNACVKHGLRALGGRPASIYGVVFMPF